MNRFQHRLRLLIVAGSTAGFVGAWGLLAHAGKPVAATSDPLPASDPAQAAAPAQVVPAQLPPLDFKSLESTSGSQNLQPLPALPAMPSFRMPRLRSGGS